MKTIACLSRGVSIDYKKGAWLRKDERSTQLEIDEIQSCVDLDSPFSLGVFASEEPDLFNVLITVKTKNTVFTGQYISAIVIFFGLEQTLARQLSIASLLDPGNGERLQKAIASAFHTDSENTSYGWDVDFASLKGVLLSDLVTGIKVDTNAPEFSPAWERDANDSNRNDLAREIAKHSFSRGCGIKVIYTNSPSDLAWRKAQDQADRLLWKEATETNLDDLRKKKAGVNQSRTVTSDTQKNKSAQQSDPSGQSIFSPNSPRRLGPRAKKNPLPERVSNESQTASPRSRQIGLSTWSWRDLILAGAGILLILLVIRGCLKKKDDPPPVAVPGQSMNATPAVDRNDANVRPAQDKNAAPSEN